MSGPSTCPTCERFATVFLRDGDDLVCVRCASTSRQGEFLSQQPPPDTPCTCTTYGRCVACEPQRQRERQRVMAGGRIP